MLTLECKQKLIDHPNDSICYTILLKASSDEWFELLCTCPDLSQWAEVFHWQFVDEWIGKDRQQKWEKLICSHTRFADKCDWKELDNNNIARILKHHPHLASHVDVTKRDGRVCALVFNVRPEVLPQCQFEVFGSSDWRDFFLEIGKAPDEVLAKCNWDKIQSDDWVKLLTSKPEYKIHASERTWRKFSEYNWRDLLRVRPEFREQFDKYSTCKFKELYI